MTELRRVVYANFQIKEAVISDRHVFLCTCRGCARMVLTIGQLESHESPQLISAVAHAQSCRAPG